MAVLTKMTSVKNVDLLRGSAGRLTWLYAEERYYTSFKMGGKGPNLGVSA